MVGGLVVIGVVIVALYWKRRRHPDTEGNKKREEGPDLQSLDDLPELVHVHNDAATHSLGLESQHTRMKYDDAMMPEVAYSQHSAPG